MQSTYSVCPGSHETSDWLHVWTLQQTEQPAESKLHWANDAFLMDCQGNLILHGLPADINVMPQSLSKLTEDCVQPATVLCLDVLCCAEKQQWFIHLVQLNEHWRVEVTRMKVAATSEGAATTKSQGQVCRCKCATEVDWQHTETYCMDGCFTLIENQ